MIEILNIDKEKSAEVYIDDIILTVTADTFKKVYKKLKNIMIRIGGAIKWAKKYNSPFEHNKFKLINFAYSNKQVIRT